MNYYEILEKLYLSNPTEVSNIAFYKQVNFLKTGQVNYLEKDGYNHLYIVYENKVFFYYSWKEVKDQLIENTESIIFTEEDLDSYDLIMLNEVQYNLIKNKNRRVEISRPLYYDNKKILVNEKTIEDFEVVAFDFDSDYKEAAEMICRCYKEYKYTERHIKQMTATIAFDPDMWVWIVEKSTNKKAALGIGDFYHPIKEGTLDWIQVDPSFHKRGVGQLLVESLISRIIKKQGSVRVTGVVDEFYKKCGLITKDDWYVIIKDRS